MVMCVYVCACMYVFMYIICRVCMCFVCVLAHLTQPPPSLPFEQIVTSSTISLPVLGWAFLIGTTKIFCDSRGRRWPLRTMNSNNVLFWLAFFPAMKTFFFLFSFGTNLALHIQQIPIQTIHIRRRRHCRHWNLS